MTHAHGHACAHHDHDHAEARDTPSRLAQAEKVCVAAGERMTAARLRTLELVLEAAGPVKAYDLIERFHDGAPAKPPTVYRALGFLEQMGLIHRIESLNAFVACDGGEHPHSAGFLLCECCGRSEEIPGWDRKGIDDAALASGFVVQRLTLEVRGLCRACAEAA